MHVPKAMVVETLETWGADDEALLFYVCKIVWDGLVQLPPNQSNFG